MSVNLYKILNALREELGSERNKELLPAEDQEKFPRGIGTLFSHQNYSKAELLVNVACILLLLSVLEVTHLFWYLNNKHTYSESSLFFISLNISLFLFIYLLLFKIILNLVYINLILSLAHVLPYPHLLPTETT